MEKKVCSKCNDGILKPLTDFIKHKECKDGRSGTCKACANANGTAWKRKNSIRLAKRRRELYKENEGAEVKRREWVRKEKYPLRYRCQVLRSGMRERAKDKGRDFDSDVFTVNYLMERITKNPNCECCGRLLDVGFKADRKFNDSSPSMDRVDSSKGYTFENVAILCWRCNKSKQDSTADQLRIIVNFMDEWGDEV